MAEKNHDELPGVHNENNDNRGAVEKDGADAKDPDVNVDDEKAKEDKGTRQSNRKRPKEDVDDEVDGEETEEDDDERPNNRRRLESREDPQAKADRWHVTLRQYYIGKEAAARYGHPGKEEIEFLCAKGVDNQPVRHNGAFVARFDLIVTPPNDNWKNRRNALLDIVDLPSTSNPQAGTEQHVPHEISFASFVAAHPEWDVNKNSWVFFRDHTDVEGHDVLIQRVQIFGSCAIHAPVTLQHYLVALHTKGEIEKTLDMPKWLRKHASSVILNGIVFGNGVVSGTILNQILVPDARFGIPVTTDCFNPADFESSMKQYGPGLVASWRVADDFNTNPPTTGPHVGAAPRENRQNPDGRHAMLVVGYRKEGEELRLLLQNWWYSKQFVEVDGEYFRSCNETAVKFVTTPQTDFPATIDVTVDAYAVCAADGAGVSGIGEPVGTTCFGEES